MLLQQDVCHVHMSSVKPTLTDENKVSRMELALLFIDKNDTSKFEHMEDLIHIDKKWFYLTKDGQCFIIAVDEAEPYRHVQHKSFLTKIMFLYAVARPRYDMNKNACFDGKIGIWHIRKWEPVDRIPSTTPGADPPRDARDSGSARSHSTHLETSSSDRP